MLGLLASDAVVTARTPDGGEAPSVGGLTESTVGARVTGIENVSCWLYEPDGAILTAGIVRAWDPTIPCQVLVVALDWPGQIILRCLVGDVRDVTLELEWGTCLPARVEQLRFDRTHGRTCELHLTSVCREVSVNPHGEMNMRCRGRDRRERHHGSIIRRPAQVVDLPPRLVMTGNGA